VSKQFDFEPAYRNYLQDLLPRWSGSHEEMYQFGLECASTGRYDTRVPMKLLTALQRISTDNGDNWEFWKRRGVFDQAARVLTKYAEEPSIARERNYFCSQIVGYAWQVGRYDQGRKALDAMNGDYSANGFGQSMTLPARTASGTYAMTGAFADHVRQAEAAVSAGRFDEGVESYEALAKQVAGADPASPWIHGRAQELRWQRQFAKGEWVDLIPTDGLAGWEVMYGEFSVDDNALTGDSSRRGALIICTERFGPRWELRGTIESLPYDQNGETRLAAVGPTFCWARGNSRFVVYLRPSLKRVALLRPTESKPTAYNRALEATNSFIIRMWDGYGEVLVNDKRFMTYGDLRAVGRRPDNRFGIESDTTAPGQQFRVKEFKIRKLDREPAH
jgi:hypothetical protein